MSAIVDLPGRAYVLRLFAECLARPKPRRKHRPLPVVVLLGTPGSGKTRVVDAIAEQCQQVVPLARLDLGQPALANLPPREIVLQLAFQLARRCRQFGRMPFRSLMLCLVIAGARIDPQNRAHALADVRAAILADMVKPEHREAIDKQLDILVRGRLLPTWAWLVAGVLLRGAESVAWRRRMGRLAGLWPGRRTGPAVNPRELLVDLGVAEEPALDEVFCLAFLADLRAAYHRGPRAQGRTANCAVLLDNIDSPAGTAFLDLLAGCRAQASGDPLLVLGTSRSWLNIWNPLWLNMEPGGAAEGARRPVRTPEQAGYADWASGPAGEPGSWGYLIGLPNLTAQQVVDLDAARSRPLGVTAAAFTHRLTTGHPLSVRAVLDRLGPTTTSRRHVLDEPWSPDAATDSVARTLRRRIIGELDRGQWATLVSFATATDLDTGGRLADRMVNRDDGGTTGLLRLLRTRLLVTSRAGHAELDPWLRRLVLHELARASPDAPASWHTTHSLHRGYHSARQDLLGALYHGLAINEIEPAVEYLAERRDQLGSETDARAWVAALNTIASAPTS